MDPHRPQWRGLLQSTHTKRPKLAKIMDTRVICERAAKAGTKLLTSSKWLLNK